MSLSRVNRRSRDILRVFNEFFSSLGERVRLYQGTGNGIALNFRRRFNDDDDEAVAAAVDAVTIVVVVTDSVVGIDCFRVGSTLT